MTVYYTTDAELTSVADAIREKGGTSAALEYPTEFVSAIAAISSGGLKKIGSETFTLTENPGSSGATLGPYTYQVPNAAFPAAFLMLVSSDRQTGFKNSFGEIAFLTDNGTPSAVNLTIGDALATSGTSGVYPSTSSRLTNGVLSLTVGLRVNTNAGDMAGNYTMDVYQLR